MVENVELLLKKQGLIHGICRQFCNFSIIILIAIRWSVDKNRTAYFLINARTSTR